MKQRKGAGRPAVPLGRSVQLKFALSYMGIIAAVLVLLNTYPVLASQDLVFRSKRTSLLNQADVLASSLAGLEVLTPEGVGQVMTLMDSSRATRVLVTDYAGMVLYDTSEQEDSLSRYALFREVVLALEGNDVTRNEYRKGAFRTWAAVPVVYRGMVLGAVYLYEYDSQQAAMLEQLQDNLRNLSAVICVLALGISLFFSRTLTRRISRLLSAIQSLREGEYSYRVNLEGRDELSALASEFNRLTERLQTTDEVRRRFVSDASHELKTPLASIRLLTDSILQSEHMDLDTTREFVADIGEEADRLNRITEKLLALTRLDNGVARPMERVDLSGVVREVLHMLHLLAGEKQVELVPRLGDDCLVEGSRDDLYQVIFNLVENGVKYNVTGGRVTVTTSRAEGRVVLRVEDTGIGIPEEELSKIFDRFYRVDKARSREAGGTGLGLSIVRDTVRQHGGDIQVGSMLGKGSWFQVTFPGCREGREGA